MGELAHNIAIYGCYGLFTFYSYQSIKKDKIWFWRWRMPFIFDVIIAVLPMVLLYNYVDTPNIETNKALTYTLIGFGIYGWALIYQPIKKLYVKTAIHFAQIPEKGFEEHCTSLGKRIYLKEFIDPFIDDKMRLPYGEFDVDFGGERTKVILKKVTLKLVLEYIKSEI